MSTAFIFFDDHQASFQRLPAMSKLGFRHALFEDNYLAGKGDLKVRSDVTGREHAGSIRGSPELGMGLKQLFIRNDDNGRIAVGLLEKYFEFPMLSMVGMWMSR